MPPAGGRVRKTSTENTTVVAAVGCEATDPATPRFLLHSSLSFKSGLFLGPSKSCAYRRI